MTDSGWSSTDLSRLRIEHDDLGGTNELDLIGITFQPGDVSGSTQGSSWSDRYHEYGFREIPGGVTRMDLTFALQAVRFVEFTVAPNWRTNDLVLDAE